MRLRRLTIARRNRVLLRDIEATFEGGETIGILGANGVGKTSLLLALAGVLAPVTGSIEIDGTALTLFDARRRAQNIALVEGTEPVLGALSVAEAVAGGRFAHHHWWDWQATPADRDAVDDALERVDLRALRDREIGTLSAGERQRVWIAVAIAQRAGIVLLDEPTSHLDLRYAIETLELMHALARTGAIVIAVLHALEEAAAFCDRIMLLGDEGVLAHGPPHIALTSATLARAYGVRIDVECRSDGLAFARRGRANGRSVQ